MHNLSNIKYIIVYAEKAQTVSNFNINSVYHFIYLVTDDLCRFGTCKSFRRSTHLFELQAVIAKVADQVIKFIAVKVFFLNENSRTLIRKSFCIEILMISGYIRRRNQDCRLAAEKAGVSAKEVYRAAQK